MSLIFYGSNVADSSLTSAGDLASSAGGVESSSLSSFTGSGTYGELCALGGTPLSTTSLPSTPTGNGWIYAIGAGSFALGNWSASFAHSDITGGIAVDFTIRFFKYSGSVYTLIGSININATTSLTRTVFTFPATSMAAVDFDTPDSLYIDLWEHDTGGVVGTDDATLYLSNSATAGVMNDLEIITPDFAAGAGSGILDPTVFGSSVADSVLTGACQMAPTTGGVETSLVTTYSTGSGNFGEVYAQGNASASAVAAIPATPSGNGWTYRPGAGTLLAGSWSASITLLAANNAGVWTLRFFKYSGGVYTSIGSITTSISATVKTTYAFAATAMPTVSLSAAEFVYIDLWYQDTVGAGADTVTVYVSTSATQGVANDMQVTTANFLPASAAGPVANPRWHRPRWILRPLVGGIFTPFQAIPAWVERALTAPFVKPTQPVTIPRYVRRSLTSILINYGLNIQTRLRLRSADQLKDIATRLILISAVQSLRDISARVRLRSADQVKDVASRFRQMSASQLKDVAARLRLMSAGQLRDIASRVRVRSTDQLKDIAARFRQRSANQLKDISSRLRIRSTDQLKDIAARLRLRSADQLKDIASRLKLAKFVDIAARLRLVASQFKDVSTRLRLRSADQLKDITARLRLRSGDQLKDVKTRLRLRSADQLRDIASRLRLRSADQLKDIIGRLRLAKFVDIASRLRLRSADQLKDVMARLRLRSADQLRDISSRLRVRSADQLKDIKARLRIRSADQLKDIASRLVLAAAQQRLKDITSRLMLRSANQFKDIQARLRLAKFVDVATRLRLRSANQLKDITARLRLKSTDRLLDIASRVRLRSADQARDIASRLKLRSPNQLRDLIARLRLMSAMQFKDITSRLRLRSADQLRDVSTRFRQMSVAQRKDVATRVRVMSAAQLRDIASRLRQISQPQPKDIRGRLILVIFAVTTKDIKCRLILVEYHVSHITVVAPRGHVDAYAPRGTLTAVGARGTLTVEEE